MAEKYDVHTVKEWLIGYQDIAREVYCQNERLERIETKLDVGAITISDMPKSPSPTGDRMADLIAIKLELEEAIGEECRIMRTMRERIEYVLGQVRSADERTVIRMRYIDGEMWGKISEMMFGGLEDYDDKADSYLRQVYRDHGYALYHIARYLDESGDPEVGWYQEIKGSLKGRKHRRTPKKVQTPESAE